MSEQTKAWAALEEYREAFYREAVAAYYWHLYERTSPTKETP